jgi:SAM-dependent methyltransferase
VNVPERIVPDAEEPGIVAKHLKRYVFARPWCIDKFVLDAGCGTGYGTAYLAESARRVIGVDLSDEALAYARGHYRAPNVEFLAADLQELAFPGNSFDAVVSFETIEHLERPEAFVDHAARVLKRDGVFVVSTPHVAITTRSPANPYHRVEFSRRDFEQLLRKRFRSVQMYGQRRLQSSRHRMLQRLDIFGLRRRLPFLRHAAPLVGTRATVDATLDDFEISPFEFAGATELVAVCRP